MITKQTKPFVKWAGGKGRLLSSITELLPQHLIAKKELTYVEPFAGGGALLFWMLRTYTNISRAVINDINADLIEAYRIVKTSPNELISTLSDIENLFYEQSSDDAKRQFYNDKRALFNTRTLSRLDNAALLIFLNHTCFNGLYRVNSKGEFNVPFGRYAKPTICDRQTILCDSQALQKVEILCGDFTSTETYASPSALFYFDPPYKPLNKTSSFTAYSKESFDDQDQIRLKEFCDIIYKRGAQFVLSNSDVNTEPAGEPFFDTLYQQYAINRVNALRSINSQSSKRGAVKELLINNFSNEKFSTSVQ